MTLYQDEFNCNGKYHKGKTRIKAADTYPDNNGALHCKFCGSRIRNIRPNSIQWSRQA
jgi:hypothetical protein